jgi:hypothetical protein
MSSGGGSSSRCGCATRPSPWTSRSSPAPTRGGTRLDLDEQRNPIEGELLDFTVFNPSAIWAAGNIVSNEHDLARFFRALLGAGCCPRRCWPR